MRQRYRNRGFTLVEQLVVAMMIAILAAFAFASFSRYPDRARYAAVDQRLGVIATEVQEYREQHDRYPDDTEPGIRPDGIARFPIARTPFNSPYDYDSFQAGAFCWVQISHYGKNKQRDSLYTEPNAKIGRINIIVDDHIRMIALGRCGEF